MRHARIHLSSTLVALAVAGALGSMGACYVGPSETESATDGTRPNPTSDGQRDAAGVEAGETSTGLPCNVQRLISVRCAACHAPPLKAPVRLVTFDDLVAKSATEPGRTLAEVAVGRMRSASSPMPPRPNAAATAEEVGAVEAWIGAGYPHGTCGSTPADRDASTPPPPPLVCTSGVFWSSGKKGTNMNPGRACIACHDGLPKPPESAVEIGGTVYPSFREPDLCLGASGQTTGAHVVITDASGQVFDLRVDTNGNFAKLVDGNPVKPPFRAKVVVGSTERAMGVQQASGDCNGCHTVDGANGAPGRITLP